MGKENRKDKVKKKEKEKMRRSQLPRQVIHCIQVPNSRRRYAVIYFDSLSLQKISHRSKRKRVTHKLVGDSQVIRSHKTVTEHRKLFVGTYFQV